MMPAHTDNILIADILEKNLEMPVDTWVQEVRQPLMPFVRFLQAAIKKAAPGLRQSALYNSRTTQRQCFMQVRWRYMHDKLPPIAQTTMSAFVRIGDYQEEGPQSVFWGLNWWGNPKDVMTVFHLFERIKNGCQLLLPDRCTRGAGVQGIFLLPKKYTAQQVLSLDHDIKKEIVEDLVRLTEAMTRVLEEM